MCLSLVMVVMSVSGLNVALPSMQRDLGASASALQWIVDSYALVFAALLLPAGALGDRFGRKRALIFGLLVFTTGSLVGGLGTGSAQVIAGRVITGIGAAFVMPATLSLLTTIFPPQERRKAIATWAGFAGAGGALGPILSGALLEHFWWGSVFLANLPIVAFVVAAVALFSPTSKDPDATPLDPVGAGLSLVGLGALVYGIIEGPELGWTSTQVLDRLRRRRHRPRGLPRLGAAVAAPHAAAQTVQGPPPERRQRRRHRRLLHHVRPLLPVHALPAVRPGLLAAQRRAVDAAPGRHPGGRRPPERDAGRAGGTGTVMATGFVLVSAGFGVLALLVGPTTPYFVLAVALVLLGAGMSLTAAPATGSIMSAVPQAKAGVGSAINDTTREVGGALGIAVLGSIASAVYRSSVDLGGLPLPPEVRKAATESVGAATVHRRAGPRGSADRRSGRRGLHRRLQPHQRRRRRCSPWAPPSPS